jgi:hypothetical protein
MTRPTSQSFMPTGVMLHTQILYVLLYHRGISKPALLTRNRHKEKSSKFSHRSSVYKPAPFTLLKLLDT